MSCFVTTHPVSDIDKIRRAISLLASHPPARGSPAGTPSKRGPAPLRASGAADADQIRALKRPSRFLTLGGHRRGFALK